MVDSNIPRWLQERVSFNAPPTSSVSQDIALGANLYQQQQQNRRQQQESALRQEALRLKMEGDTFVKAGAIELGRLMEKGGREGSYATDQFEGELWSLGQRFPQLIESDTFKGAAKVVENAKMAKNRAATTEYIQTELTRRNEDNINSRYDLLNRRIDGALEKTDLTADRREELERLKGELTATRDELKAKTASDLEKQRQGGRESLEDKRQEGREDLQGMRDEAALNRQRQALENSLTLLDAKSEDAKEIRQLQNELDTKRDAAKTKVIQSSRFDLPQSEQKAYELELGALARWRKQNAGSKMDAEFDRRLNALRAKYASKKTSAKVDEEKPVLTYDPATRTFK
jgi:hypothetical protein